MFFQPRITVLLACAAFIGLAHASVVSAGDGRYLNWHSKTATAAPQGLQAQPAPVSVRTPVRAPVTQPQIIETPQGPAIYYGTPPSPYGQVGHMGPQTQRYASAPVAYSALATQTAAPQTSTRATAAYPEAPPVREVHASAPQNPTSPAQPPRLDSTGGYTQGGYQVPASSPYASRIASARARHEAPAAQAPFTATAPSLSAPLSDQATGAYIPAEAMTNSAAASEPRYYSLHRQYGLEPDPLAPSQPSQGALLIPSALLDEDQSADDNAMQRVRPSE